MKIKRLYVKLKRWYIADVSTDTDALACALFEMGYKEDRLLMYGYDAYGYPSAWLNMKSTYDVNRLICMLGISKICPSGRRIEKDGVCYYNNRLTVFI